MDTTRLRGCGGPARGAIACALLGLAALPAALAQDALCTGDFLFQDLACGPLCEAIESVTPALDGQHFSHVGLVERRGDSVFVIEAISVGGVVRTPYATFAARAQDGPRGMAHMRPRSAFAELTPAVLSFCDSVMGTPYDEVYAIDNDRYYCSELLYDAYAYANGGTPVFELGPMTFKIPGEEAFEPAWVAYYEALGATIPEGEPGCNPGGIATGEVLERVGATDANATRQ